MRVLVAMSGGVDSTVAASLLVEEGHEVVGVTLKLWGGPSDSGCCSAEDSHDARRVAAALDIPHHVFDYEDGFIEHVVDPYIAAHQEGLTPNPCVECNRHVKFALLAQAAERMGFERLATGHHAQVRHSDSGPQLRRGADFAKDQSYVLGMLTEPQLEGLLLPVGSLTKEAVREHASKRGLATAMKPDSQDLCFVSTSLGRAAFLADRMELHPGTVVEAGSGATVGTVTAVELVTLGQGKGMGRDEQGRRRYVTAIDHERRTVTAGPMEEIEYREVAFVPSSLTTTAQPLEQGRPVLIQAAAHGRVDPAILDLERSAIVREQGGRPIAPGQLAVLYDPEDPDRVLGSAVVARRG